MRSLAMAMLIMGGIFGLVGIALMLRGASAALGVLVPAMFLIVAGIIWLTQQRR